MIKKPGLEEYKIVDGNTILQAGDRVVLITDAEKTKKILSNFTGN